MYAGKGVKPNQNQLEKKKWLSLSSVTTTNWYLSTSFIGQSTSLTKVSDPDTPKDLVNIKFVESSLISLGLLVQITLNEKEVLEDMTKITTLKYKGFSSAIYTVGNITNRKIIAFHERSECGYLLKLC